MADRLSTTEDALLALDTTHHPNHVGTVDVFRPGPGGLDHDRLLRLVRDRLDYVPRYRMRVRHVPFGLAAPVWVEDDHFDLSFHVRRSAVPRPGSMEQLREFVGRVMARRLDHSRPLWEMYLVEGLEDDRFAIITKTHQLLVDGQDHVDIGQVLLDEVPGAGELREPGWEPRPEPSSTDLLVQTALETVRDPLSVLATVRRGVTAALGTAVTVGEAVGGIGGAVGAVAADLMTGSRPPSNSPLTGVVSEQRRFASAVVPLSELKALRVAHQCTINDVVLAILTGALRSWLQARGDGRVPSTLTACVPMSVIDEDGTPSSLGSRVAPHLMPLPVGEPNALMRLHQVTHGTKAHKDTGRAVGARSIVDIAGFAPTTLHNLGVRVAGQVMRRQHDLLITNVPGPQQPRYVDDATLVASYPVLPLTAGHILTIGVTSYDGEVFVGLNGDRDRASDLDVLAQSVEESRAELAATVEQARSTRTPTRRRRSGPTPPRPA
ncbi:wax ester/triacylglycerol synthase family O-acyltransferase [Auraticoccus sp. F435]|uniref:Diacylglycerol O-acyltransferase n=1 Tax=Auraticoccus cholistanensis TaxID=2656650 RepID=A0A6A9V1H2_9ACTN|nr:wax ester/triacylglycerol synthase family O-acyltransferase [Auraticoccus cholistanensis]MVA77409.1 wax ester/triacylglycerol synthase family O-acyltransferase [Auraticoccus cholistanensis]